MQVQAILEMIERYKQKCLLPKDVRVVVSYEAGQDGFWVYQKQYAGGCISAFAIKAIGVNFWSLIA
ncbi:hypothetical protein [Mycetohabitans rhizoxinica]|uniref:hypothetical protein n=1 Tax=Mycetohabitans rhizoxinica TaxID=412963 RepID=UPI0030CBA0C9